MSFTINLQNYSDNEMTAILLGCSFLFILILFKIFEQMKGVDFFSFLFPGMPLSQEQKSFFGKSLKQQLPRILFKLVLSLVVFFVIVWVQGFLN